MTPQEHTAPAPGLPPPVIVHFDGEHMEAPAIFDVQSPGLPAYPADASAIIFFDSRVGLKPAVVPLDRDAVKCASETSVVVTYDPVATKEPHLLDADCDTADLRDLARTLMAEHVGRGVALHYRPDNILAPIIVPITPSKRGR